MGKGFKRFARVVINCLYRVKEYNKPDLTNGQYILAPNHVSRILAKKECFQHKWMAALLNFADIVKVDRDAHNGVELLAAIDYFKDGKNKLFMLFPQGTISDLNKNKITRIKSGAFFVSAKANVPIVPVFLEQPRLFRRTRVIYGRPFYMEGAVKDGKVDKKALEPYRLRWQKEVLELQDSATSYEKRPVRKLKLKPKHQNNNE